MFRPGRSLFLLVGSLALLADPANAAPHWDPAACSTCHTSDSPVRGTAALRGDSKQSACDSCHGARGEALPCQHISDRPAGSLPVPETYRMHLDGGNVVCTTCHDLTVQCLAPDPLNGVLNPGFLRARESRSTGDVCLDCHESDLLEPLNPHNPSSATDVESGCLFCHESMPAVADGQWRYTPAASAPLLDEACRGCHWIQPHPGSMFAMSASMWSHLVVPSPEVQKKMAETEADTGLRFPVEPGTGRLRCTTCHNPHAFQPDGYPPLELSDQPNRLRAENLCQACHDYW